MNETPSAPRSSVSMLDALLVLLVGVTMAGVLAGLFFVKAPQENLPIISGLAYGLMGIVIGGYAGYRWGASDASKRTPPPAEAPAADAPPSA